MFGGLTCPLYPHRGGQQFALAASQTAMNSLFADAALCGPTNDLKTLTSRLDTDRGVRRVSCGGGRADAMSETRQS